MYKYFENARKEVVAKEGRGVYPPHYFRKYWLHEENIATEDPNLDNFSKYSLSFNQKYDEDKNSLISREASGRIGNRDSSMTPR